MIDLPDSIMRMEIISADLAALALTGIIEAGTVDNAKMGNYTGCQEAELHKSAIISAVRASKLKAHTVTISGDDIVKIRPEGLRKTDDVVDVEVYAKDLWMWLSPEKNKSGTGKLNPLEELQAAKNEFISLREVFDSLTEQFPDASLEELAEWMIKKLCYESHIQVFMKGIAGKLNIPDRDYPFDDNPFLLNLLSRVINNGHDALTPKEKDDVPLDFDDIPF